VPQREYCSSSTKPVRTLSLSVGYRGCAHERRITLRGQTEGSLENCEFTIDCALDAFFPAVSFI